MSSSSSKSLNSSSFKNVIHNKKMTGTLIVTNSHLNYYPIGNIHNNNSNVHSATPMLQPISIPWSNVTKHQVSPISYPKFLLKIHLSSNNGSTSTFSFGTRMELDQIRREISLQITNSRRTLAQNSTTTTSSSSSTDYQSPNSPRNNNQHNNNKRLLNSSSNNNSSSQKEKDEEEKKSWYGNLSPTALAVTRSSLLSSNPILRKQHELLVKETTTLSEDDFWSTHASTLADEYAKIYGKVRAGMSSNIKSNLELSNNSNSGGINRSSNNVSSSKDTSGSSSKGKKATGSSSGIGGGQRIRLGVEEMRQIFILYPAVHKAYETKVPLELSEEQFWRKYLESEYFHRDRGRIGSFALMEKWDRLQNKNNNDKKNKNKSKNQDNDRDNRDEEDDNKKDNKDDIISAEQLQQQQQQQQKENKEAHENARVAAVGTDDIFSRLDADISKIKRQRLASHPVVTPPPTADNTNNHIPKNQLAIGQFDLVSTTNTERGHKLLLSDRRDLHPDLSCMEPIITDSKNGSSKEKSSHHRHNPNNKKGSRVIDKYNRHWAMVLHPEDATAGCDLTSVARKSVHLHLQENDDAKVNGGSHIELQRLVHFANAPEGQANHVMGLGNEDQLYKDLKLQNLEVYKTGGGASNNPNTSAEMQIQLQRKRKLFSQQTVRHVKNMVNELQQEIHHCQLNLITDPNAKNKKQKQTSNNISQNVFPSSSDFGSMLLGALTKRMATDSQTESDAIQVTNALPPDFKDKLHSYFRRSSELLRHFFGIRRIHVANTNNKKLQRIVEGMEGVYREMETVRKELPQTPTGETMRKMCLPIMDQLDWAFKLHREGAGGGGGGFVTIDEF